MDHLLPFEYRAGLRFKLPAGIVLPLQAEVSPVGILGKNQRDLLFFAPSLDLELPRSGAPESRMLFIPDERVVAVAGSKAVRVELELVVDNASAKVARHAGIEPTRLVGHEINPELLHKAAAFYHLMGSGADSSASRKRHKRYERHGSVRPRNGGVRGLGSDGGSLGGRSGVCLS